MIERDEDMDRTYIPVSASWEIQTKGKGSSFRIANTVTNDRWLVGDSYIHEPLTNMALAIHEELASLRQQLAEEQRENEELRTALKAN